MVRHVVIFVWIEGTTDAQVKAFRAALDDMASRLKELTVIQHGSDLHFREGNGDYALVATFADRAAWDAYQTHPVHKAFVRDFVAPIQDSRLTIQF